MRIVCDKCDAKYVVPDEKIVRKTVRLTCRKCGNVITARVDDEVSESATLGKWRQNMAGLQKRDGSENPGWYYSYNGESFGPYTQSELETKVASPALQPIAEQCYVWHKSLETWRPLTEIEPFASAAIKPPPAPPAPKKAPVSAGLPPLYAGKTANVRLTNTAQRVSPNVSALKQRLMASTAPEQQDCAACRDETRIVSDAPTVTQDSPMLSGEAPTHQAMPMVEEIMTKAMTEVQEGTGETNRPSGQGHSKGVPLVSFQSLDVIPGVSCEGEHGKQEAVSKPFPTLASIRPVEKKSASQEKAVQPITSIPSKPALGKPGAISIPSAGKNLGAPISTKPRVPGALTSALGSGPGSLGTQKPKSQANGLSLGTLANKSGLSLGSGGMKPVAHPEGDQVGQKKTLPKTSETALTSRVVPATASPSETKPTPALGASADAAKGSEPSKVEYDENAVQLRKEACPDNGPGVRMPQSDVSSEPGAKVDNAPTDDRVTGMETKDKQDDATGTGLSRLDKAMASFCEDLDQVERKAVGGLLLEDGLAIDLDANVSFDAMAPIDLDLSSEEAVLEDVDADNDVADAALSENADDALPDSIDLNRSLTDEPPADGDFGAIDLDMCHSLPELSPCAEVQNTPKDIDEDGLPASSDGVQELSGFAIDLDDEASCLIPEELVNEITENADVAEAEGAKRETSVARIRAKRLEDLQRRQAELAAASAALEALDHPEANPDGPSESSMLIDLAHLARLEKESKNKRNVKFIAILVALVVIVLSVAVAGGINLIHSDEERDSKVSLGTTAGRMIDSDALDRHVEEIKVDLPKARSGEKTQRAHQAVNADATHENVESKTSDDLGAVPLPTKRTDGRQSVVLERPTEFGSTDHVTGSKYSGQVGKTAAEAGPDRIEVGWRKITPTVNACQKRLAKTGSLKVDAFYLNLQVADSGKVTKFNVSPEKGTEELVKCLESKKDTWDFGKGEPVSVRKKFVN